MLLTTCPNCAAQFKVQPEQLNVRQGRVMCGRCRQVFDAFQSLTRIEDSVSRTEQAPSETVKSSPADGEAPETAEAGLPGLTHGEGGGFLELGDAGTPAREPELENGAWRPWHSEAGNFEEVSLPRAEDNSSLLRTESQPGLVLESDNQLLAAPTRVYQPEPIRSGAWPVLALMLAIVLLAQLVYAFRSQIAQQFPVTRPALAAVCEFAGCTLHHGRDESMIRIEASDLIEAPGRTGRILFTATISNRSNSGQDYPSLELRLSDSSNQAVVSRVFAPADYLGRAIGKHDLIPPGGEVFVNMQIELQGRALASGYGVRAFYP